MFRIFLLVTAIALFHVQAIAQPFSISGKVNGKNEMLAGATVELREARRYAVTDELGQFAFFKVNAGQYTLIIKYMGYATATIPVTVNGDSPLDVTLEESVQMTDEVIVYATRATDKTPTTHLNLSKQAIQKQNFGQDLPFLLNWTPSLVTTSDAGAGIGYTGIRIRGSDATRINVTINGIPYNDSETQGTFWVNIPDIASSLQSIQIQRGVGTSTNGGSAFGATVNLETSALSADPYAEVSAGAGSFNTVRTVLKAGTGLINNHWAIDARVSRINSDGYIERASSDLRSYFISGGYYSKKTIVKALMFGGHEQTYQAWYGVDAETMKNNRRFNYAGAIYDENFNVLRYYDQEEDNYRQDHYQLHASHQFNEHWNASLSLHYTYGRGYYEQYLQGQQFADYGLNDIVLKDTTLTGSDFIVRRWLDNDFYGTTFSLNYEHGKMNFVLGGGYNEYTNARHFGEIIWAQYAGDVPLRHKWYEGETHKTDLNLYSKLTYSITDRLSAFGDLQYRGVNYRTGGTDDDLSSYAVRDQFNFINPKAGLSYTLAENNVLYASYAIAHREPNRTDYLEGLVKPKAERLSNLEMGWRKSNASYSIEANYYLMNYIDQLVLTGALDNVGNPIRANVGKSVRTGVELNGGLRPGKAWMINANATWSINRNRDFVLINDENEVIRKNTTIILSPSIVAGSQVAWSGLKNVQIAWLSKYVSKQYLDNTENEDLTLDAYFVNDLRFTYAFPVKGIQTLEASLLVNNLFSAEYSSNGYTYFGTPYFYPQATRNFLAMITVRF